MDGFQIVPDIYLDRNAHQFLIKEAEKLGLHQSGSLLQDCLSERTQD